MRSEPMAGLHCIVTVTGLPSPAMFPPSPCTSSSLRSSQPLSSSSLAFERRYTVNYRELIMFKESYVVARSSLIETAMPKKI